MRLSTDMALQELTEGLRTTMEVAEVLDVSLAYAGTLLGRLRARSQARSWRKTTEVGLNTTPDMTLVWEITSLGRERLEYVKDNPDVEGHERRQEAFEVAEKKRRETRKKKKFEKENS